MESIVGTYDEIKQRLYNLEDENEKLEKENADLLTQMQGFKRECESAQQELNFLVKNHLLDIIETS